MKIIKIWIEAEEVVNERCYDNENTDVIVTFDDKSEYVCTFFTYRNIEQLRKKNMESDECLAGKYFWAPNSIIVDTCDRGNIEYVISHLIEKGDFVHVFRKTGE